MLASALDSVLSRTPRSAPEMAGTRLIETRVGRLRVHDTGGQGPALLMVPDGPNVIEHHAALIAQLAPQLRVICFDMPGFGFSAPGLRYDHSLDKGAAAVLALMDALDIKQAALQFTCANGFYALAAAKLAPQRITHLLLCQTPSLQAMRDWADLNVPKPLRIPVLGQVLNRVGRRKLSNIWYSLALPDKSLRPAYRATACTALDHGACFCLAGVTQGLLRATEDQVTGVRQPVQVIWGSSDFSHRKTRAESVLDLLPQAQLHHFTECGHYPHLEQPQRYAQLALAALA